MGVTTLEKKGIDSKIHDAQKHCNLLQRWVINIYLPKCLEIFCESTIINI